MRAAQELRLSIEELAQKLEGYGHVVTSHGPTPIEDREPRYAAIARLCTALRTLTPRCGSILSVEVATEIRRAVDEIEDRVMPQLRRKVEKHAEDPANLGRLFDDWWRAVYMAEGSALVHSARSLRVLAKKLAPLA